MRAWDQQTGEPDDAFKAFQLWCDHSETIRNTFEFCLVLRDHGVSYTESTIDAYRARYQWEKRRKKRANWRRMKEENRIAERAAEAKTRILDKRTEAATIAANKAIGYLKQLPDTFAEDSPAKNVAAISQALEAARQTLEVLGLSCLDSDDLIRELAKRLAGKGSRRRKPLAVPNPEDLLGLPDESGEIQPGSPQTSRVLDATSPDLQGRCESSDSDGPGSVG